MAQHPIAVPLGSIRRRTQCLWWCKNQGRSGSHRSFPRSVHGSRREPTMAYVLEAASVKVDLPCLPISVTLKDGRQATVDRATEVAVEAETLTISREQ